MRWPPTTPSREYNSPRETYNVRSVTADSIAHDARDDQRARVRIVEACSRRTGLRLVCGERGHVALGVQHPRGRIEAAARLCDGNAAGHAQEVVEGDRVARIARVLPRGDRRERIGFQPSLADQHADQAADHRLARRITQQRRVYADTRSVAFGDHLAVLEHHHRAEPAVRWLVGLGEHVVECRAQEWVGRHDDLRTGELRQQWYGPSGFRRQAGVDGAGPCNSRQPKPSR